MILGRREVRKKGGKVSLKSREWVMAKKERRRRQGKGYEIFVHIYTYMHVVSNVYFLPI